MPSRTGSSVRRRRGAELQTADVGGRKISFAGAGADGDVILLVHGYGGDRNSWLFLQEPLAAKYRVYALDLPGHMPHMERPAEVQAAIEETIARTG